MIIGFLGLFGVAIVVTLPFFVGRRFGWHVVLYGFAILGGCYAMMSPWLVETAKVVSTCNSSSAMCSSMQGIATLILRVDQIGWWWIAGFILLNGILLHVVKVFGGIPVPNMFRRKDCRIDRCAWEQNVSAQGTIGACNTCRFRK